MFPCLCSRLPALAVRMVSALALLLGFGAFQSGSRPSSDSAASAVPGWTTAELD